MVNVHASGGARMMEAARQSLEPYGKEAPLLTAVTVLTSMDESDLIGVGINLSCRAFGLINQTMQADGVVCSAHEAQRLKQICGADFKISYPRYSPNGK